MQLYDYQYNMGLLLMERNEWGQQTEKLKSIAQDAEEKLQRELAAHLLAVAEAEKREESLKQALAAEKLCVYDVSILLFLSYGFQLGLGIWNYKYAQSLATFCNPSILVTVLLSA